MHRTLIGFLLAFGCTAALSAGDLWLAVGYGGRRMISTDGKTWEITAEWAQPGGDDGNNLMGAVYAQNKFVVVGGGGGGATGAGHILVSTDGREWKQVHKDKSRINPIVYGNGRFVVGTSSYPSGKLLLSTDAETWTPGAAIAEKGLTHFRHGAFGNGMFVLVGNGQRKGPDDKPEPFHWSIVSPDGEKITGVRTDLKSHGRIVFGNGRFVMLSHDGVMLTSADGLDWKEQTFTKDERPGWAVWDGTRFLAGNYKTGLTSADGLAWTTDGGIKSAPGVMWSDGTRFVATGWPGKMFYSADGKTFEKCPPLPDNGINVVVHAPRP